MPLKDIIFDVCGGIPNGKRCKAVIPGGSSTAMLTESELDCVTTYEGMQEAGSSLGTASPIVMDEDTNIVRAMRRIADFYAHESCGQCVQCREGTYWAARILRRIETGDGRLEDIDTLWCSTSCSAFWTGHALGSTTPGGGSHIATRRGIWQQARDGIDL